MRSIITGLLLIGSSLASELSASYGQYLNGSQMLTPALIDRMYGEYRMQPRDSTLERYLNSINADRKTIFTATLRSIVEHNSNPANTWTKGLNEFSDMTEKEFADYYRIVKSD